MEKLLSQQYDYVVRETLGKSVFDKCIDLITISAPHNLTSKKEVTMTMDDEEGAERKRKCNNIDQSFFRRELSSLATVSDFNGFEISCRK